MREYQRGGSLGVSTQQSFAKVAGGKDIKENGNHQTEEQVTKKQEQNTKKQGQ